MEKLQTLQAEQDLIDQIILLERLWLNPSDVEIYKFPEF